jgi:hypothetical protein
MVVSSKTTDPNANRLHGLLQFKLTSEQGLLRVTRRMCSPAKVR